MKPKRFAFLALIVVSALALSWLAAQPPKAGLELKPGDHVCVIGNTLADRMQHDAWLDAFLHARFPRHDLVIRHLGFSADELTIRLRSMDFGSPDQWLTRCKADVIFACFGYNESFADEPGLPRFKHELEQFIQHTRAQKYNGTSSPRLVLVSPIAHEAKDRHRPDPAENNRRLALYTRAMGEVAQASRVPFIDLFSATQQLYAAGSDLTINGIHLNEEGYRQMAQHIDRQLFGPSAAHPTETLDRIRTAAKARNFMWFQRYRTVDGYSMYGGRADLKFVDGQTNREVMNRELEVLDVLTANHDRRVWAAARHEPTPADLDKNLPPFIPVKTNKPGPLPGGKHLFLSGEEAIGKMTVPQGVKVNLFADEAMFPEMVNPVQMAFDPHGRLWVAVWPTYPHWKPTEPMNDKLLILEDTTGDGKADRCTVFADDLHCPTGFEFCNGGVLVAQPPDLVFLKDTNGDGKADLRQRVLHGLDSADTHHAANSFVIDPGGAIYFQEGTFHHTQVETPWGPPRRCVNAGVFRYEPRTQKFDVYITHGFANPHGHAFDRWGQDIVVDGTGADPYHATLFSGHLEFPEKHRTPPKVYRQRTRPCPGIEFVSSRHFPESWQGNLLVPNVIGFQGILRYKITDNGSSFEGSEQEPLLSSTDPNFRPSDLKIGPDGALYFLDWHNPIIGHMQHNLRDPSRDRDHGRVYRVTHAERPLVPLAKIAGEPIEKLLELLKEPEDRVRSRAKIELGSRPSDLVIAATKRWLAGLDAKHADYEHHRLEGLWVHQYHDTVDVPLLEAVLASPDFRARAAAARVLCSWRDRVPGALERFKTLAADAHPRVRLEAVRAASFFTEAEALEVVLIAGDKPTDAYLNFTISETRRALDPHVKRALAANRPVKFTTPAGQRFFIKTLAVDDLAKLPRTQEVGWEILSRGGVRDELRAEVVDTLAKMENQTPAQVLIAAIERQDQAPPDGTRLRMSETSTALADLFRALTQRPPMELSPWRAAVARLASDGRQATTRTLAYVALAAADQSPDRVWGEVAAQPARLVEFLAAVPMLRDPAYRLTLYPKLIELIAQSPESSAESAVNGRFVRIELYGNQRTLTLAEVEVYSGGVNVARQGTARQSTTDFGGVASRAIDGNTSGKYADGGQSHTQVGRANPWWEVDLGREVAIDRIEVYGRTEAELDFRLNNYTIKVLDAQRRTLFERKGQPTPQPKAVHEVADAAPQRQLRRAAMRALPSVRGKEAESARVLLSFLANPAERGHAAAALLRIAPAHWPKDSVPQALEHVMAFVRGVPASERSTPAVVDALQVADGLATLLPLDQARAVRKELGELGVRMLRLATVPDQMIFDQDRMVVRAGKPVEILLENPDLMPHNFALVQPGALEEVGNLAETTATAPDALARHYIPRSDRILVASQLLQPRESQKLAFTAPAQPGVYPYVCTYPGHWRRMYGALYVVADLDDYLADPESYLSRHPLPIRDELLKFNRPRKEWKFEDLADAVAKLDHGRSFAAGKSLFQIASCTACHKLNGVGAEIGPDLTQYDKTWKPTDILREVVDPSHRIHEKFQTWVIETRQGRLITGLIVAENRDEIKLIENPLASATPIIIKLTDVEARQKSPKSVMPTGLLDKLTKEEILDLLAYVIARGDAAHPLFEGHASHGHGRPGR
jgi:putative heme-binding domain-containing protein